VVSPGVIGGPRVRVGSEQGGVSRNGVRGFYIFKTLTNLFLKSEPLGFFQFKEVTKDSKG